MIVATNHAVVAPAFLLAAVAVGLYVLAVAVALDRARLRRRSARRLSRFEPAAPQTWAVDGPAEPATGWLQRLGSLLGRRLSPWGRRQMQQALSRAGLHGRPTVEELLAMHLLSTVAGLVAGLVAGGLLIGLLGPLALLTALGGAVLGSGVPPRVLAWLAARRQQRIQEALPNTLDILTVSLTAGLAFDTSVTYICDRLDNAVTAELRVFLADLRLGRSRREALTRLVERTESDDVRRFTNEVLQAELLGVGLATALQAQVALLRTERRQHADALSRQVPIKLLFPMTLFILPVLFIVLLGPAVLAMLAAFAGAS